MTEELEHKAEEYAKKSLKGFREYIYLDQAETKIEDAYIAGAIENGVQWHDLRKDPNDLPKDDRFVIGVYKVTPFDIAPKVETCCYSETLTGWSDIEGNSLYNEIERWFDPQFKE